MTLEPESVARHNRWAPFASPDVKDAYLTMNDIPGLGTVFASANFFVPFSLEQVTNDTNNIFMERSIPTQGIFAADREVGVAHLQTALRMIPDLDYCIFFDSISGV